jgi:hypothetical protein
MIYLDGVFAGLAAATGVSYLPYKDCQDVPGGCKLIGKTFYSNKIDEHQPIIHELSKKTETLLIYFSEPTDIKVIDYVVNNTNPKIKFFSDVVLNFSTANIKTAISWFIFPENFYNMPIWANPLLSQLKSNFDRSKQFDCLLGSSKTHRDVVEQLYLNSDVKDQIIFSYFKNSIDTGIWDYNVSSIRESHERIIYSDIAVPASAIIPISIYNQSYYSIVAETIANNQYSQFTEKVVKPMVARRAFICFSGQHYLRNLKSLGFKTFDNVIDESYDTIADTHQRFSMAWQQVEYLCRQDPKNIIPQIQTTLEHNYQHFLATDWHSEIKKYFN